MTYFLFWEKKEKKRHTGAFRQKSRAAIKQCNTKPTHTFTLSVSAFTFADKNGVY